MLIRTIPKYDYSTVDDRAFTHDGVIVDVGCAGWDWCEAFIGKKRVIGVDPFEKTTPPNTELARCVIGAVSGSALMQTDGDASSSTSYTTEDTISVLMHSWKDFCFTYDIKNISVLKLNIEGMEYSLLHSMDSEDFSKIDQIAVSFHDWMKPEWSKLTLAAIHLLQMNNFNVHKLDSEWGWFLAIKNRQ